MARTRGLPEVATFVESIDDTFTLEDDEGETAEMRLLEIDRPNHDRGDEWESFTLSFEPVDGKHPEGGIYRVTHPETGAFHMHVHPVATLGPDPDEIGYEATCNVRVGTASADTGSLLEDVSRRGVLASVIGLAAGGSLLQSLFGSGPVGQAAAANGGQFIGAVQMFGFDWTPQGWARCDGQALPINQHQALFSLLGTRYGGDGRTTFHLPDLRGRVPIHQGDGPGGTYQMGAEGGRHEVTLDADEMPVHDHEATGATLPVSTGNGNATSPNGNALAAQPEARGTVPVYSDESAPGGSMPITGSVTERGGGRAHENMPPYSVVNYCIALQGTFPPRR